MRSRVDLHFHLLPGLDDGPATFEESLALARAAAAEGTGTIVATPHLRGDFVTDVRELPDRVRELRGRLAAAGLAMRVLCGAELGVDMVGRLSQTELDLVAVGPPGGSWLLLETPFETLDERLHGAAEELRDRGFGVVLAHPEHNVAFADPAGDALRTELARGSALQLNASSLDGRHGPAAQAAAVRLLLAGAADAIASDAHSRQRGPALGRGLRAAVALGVPERVARRPIDAGPARLVHRGFVRRVPAAA